MNIKRLWAVLPTLCIIFTLSTPTDNIAYFQYFEKSGKYYGASQIEYLEPYTTNTNLALHLKDNDKLPGVPNGTWDGYVIVNFKGKSYLVRLDLQ